MTDTGLTVEGLSIAFRDNGRATTVVQDVNFTLRPGEIVALVGESGSGKSVTARALVGLAGHNAVVTAQRLSLDGRELSGLDERQWRTLRGKAIGFVPQDAMVSLDPLRTVGKEVIEPLVAHRWGDRRRRYERAVEALTSAGMPDPERRMLHLPGTLSGGLRQRALIASAIVMDPPLLIADEPTTALDPTTQLQILHLLRSLRDQGKGILLISHDLGFVSRLADRILVMKNGVVVETGDARAIINQPVSPYTKALVAAATVHDPRKGSAASPDGEPILEARNLSKVYRDARGVDRVAVDDVSFSVQQGESLGIVGESGSGKTTIARILLGLTKPVQGSVLFQGVAWNGPAGSPMAAAQRRIWRRKIGIIYQDPLSSFDPRWNVRAILEDARDAATETTGDHGLRSVQELLELVRLDPSIAERHPRHLSGGQRQRVAIARALATNPSVLICDEPVSALDVSVQAQILNLLSSLQTTLGITLLLISHDMAVVRRMCDVVIVMKDGRVVEASRAESLFENPKDPFTKRMIESAMFIATRLPVPLQTNILS